MCLLLCYSCIITNLKARITDTFATITEDMLGNTWREIDYPLDVLRATKGAHVEVYWCVVKKKKSFLSYISKKKISLYSTYSSFVVINVCNQGKTLCYPVVHDRQLVFIMACYTPWRWYSGTETWCSYVSIINLCLILRIYLVQ